MIYRREVKRSGTGGHVMLPRSMLGKKVMVMPMDDIDLDMKMFIDIVECSRKGKVIPLKMLLSSSEQEKVSRTILDAQGTFFGSLAKDYTKTLEIPLNMLRMVLMMLDNAGHHKLAEKIRKII